MQRNMTSNLKALVGGLPLSTTGFGLRAAFWGFGGLGRCPIDEVDFHRATCCPFGWRWKWATPHRGWTWHWHGWFDCVFVAICEVFPFLQMQFASEYMSIRFQSWPFSPGCFIAVRVRALLPYVPCGFRMALASAGVLGVLKRSQTSSLNTWSGSKLVPIVSFCISFVDEIKIEGDILVSNIDM